MKNYLKLFFSYFGFAIVRHIRLKELIANQNSLMSLARWYSEEVPSSMLRYVIQNSPYSKSQLQQDLLVGYFYPEDNSEKFFVEFGATDGVSLSNTYFLEKTLGWKGLLCEPAKIWHNQLRSNRNCKIDYRCVHPLSQSKVKFSETRSPELSSITSFADIDLHASARVESKDYLVSTISLNDLLQEHNAPKIIDYLSIDTEGSEYEILKNFPFEKWRISMITVEHNYSKNRILLNQLLLSKGYFNILATTSLFDGWYVSAEIYSKFESRGTSIGI
jgi:FkbM family methyltransferase